MFGFHKSAYKCLAIEESIDKLWQIASKLLKQYTSHLKMNDLALKLSSQRMVLVFSIKEVGKEFSKPILRAAQWLLYCNIYNIYIYVTRFAKTRHNGAFLEIQIFA